MAATIPRCACGASWLRWCSVDVARWRCRVDEGCVCLSGSIRSPSVRTPLPRVPMTAPIRSARPAPDPRLRCRRAILSYAGSDQTSDSSAWIPDGAVGSGRDSSGGAAGTGEGVSTGVKAHCSSGAPDAADGPTCMTSAEQSSAGASVSRLLIVWSTLVARICPMRVMPI